MIMMEYLMTSKCGKLQLHFLITLKITDSAHLLRTVDSRPLIDEWQTLMGWKLCCWFSSHEQNNIVITNCSFILILTLRYAKSKTLKLLYVPNYVVFWRKRKSLLYMQLFVLSPSIALIETPACHELWYSTVTVKLPLKLHYTSLCSMTHFLKQLYSVLQRGTGWSPWAPSSSYVDY